MVIQAIETSPARLQITHVKLHFILVEASSFDFKSNNLRTYAGWFQKVWVDRFPNIYIALFKPFMFNILKSFIKRL